MTDRAKKVYFVVTIDSNRGCMFLKSTIIITFSFEIHLQRFGTALVAWGQLHLKNKRYAIDFEPIDRDCGCLTCKHHTRAYINCLLGREEVACHLLTIHNIYYQVGYKSYKQHYLIFNRKGKHNHLQCNCDCWR